MNVHSEVWPTDINQIPPHMGSWLPAEDKHEDCGVYAKQYRGGIPKRTSLQMRQPPGAYDGFVIGNHNIPQSLQRIVTSRNKNSVTPGPTLSFHNIQYTVKRRRCNLIGTRQPYHILKGIRYVFVCEDITSYLLFVYIYSHLIILQVPYKFHCSIYVLFMLIRLKN